jgi:hypothetical protein
MTTRITDGGSAFPVVTNMGVFHDAHGNEVQDIQSIGGMSLRDYFAAQAMVGIVARMNADTFRKYVAAVADGREMVAAYRMADAMLAAREAK